ncbi:unnamed protein product, partial [Meganyctiphanes norvegica]
MILLESVLTSLMDAYPKHFTNRKIATLAICLPLILMSMIFCIGNGTGEMIYTFLDIYLIDRTSWSNMSWLILIFVYLYGAGRLVRDIRHILPRISLAVSWPCYLSWIIIVPIAYAVSTIKIITEFMSGKFLRAYCSPDFFLPISQRISTQPIKGL